jgi:hypothetical protein
LDFRDHNRIFHLGVSHIEGSVNKYGNTKERRVFLLGDKYG